MSIEGAPEPAEGVFCAEGTINEGFIAEHYGLGPEEASQEIQFGSYNGTVAQMLADEACPIGSQIHNAYEQEGIDGVTRVFEGIKLMDPNFSVEISETTLEREHAKQSQISREEIAGESDKEHDQDDRDNKQEEITHDHPEAAAGTTASPDRLSAEEETIARQREAEETKLAEEANQVDEEQLPAEAETRIAPNEEPGAIKKMAFETKPEKTEGPSLEEEFVLSVPSAGAGRAAVHSGVQRAQITQGHELEEPRMPERRLDEQAVEPASAPTPEDTIHHGQVIEPNGEANMAELLAVAEEARGQEDIAVIAEVSTDTPPLRAPETAREIATREFAETIQFIAEEKTLDGKVGAELTEFIYPAVVEISRQVNDALQEPEVIESETAQAAIANVAQVIENIKLLEAAGEDSEVAEQQLIVACEKLLDELGISYEEETAEQFAKLIVATRKVQPVPEKQAAAEAAADDEGTHELKAGNLGTPRLTLAARHKFMPLRALGQWALTSSLAG